MNELVVNRAELAPVDTELMVMVDNREPSTAYNDSHYRSSVAAENHRLLID